MKQEESLELTREEAIARWKREQKKDKQRFEELDKQRLEELEREPWRISKKIKVQTPHHFVIVPNPIERVSGIGKITIDKLTESITIEKRYLLMIPTQRVIPLSAIRSVVWNYKPQRSLGRSEEWQISLDTHDEKIKIFFGTKVDDMLDLATGISKLIGKEFIVESDKPEWPTPTFDANKLPRDWDL